MAWTSGTGMGGSPGDGGGNGGREGNGNGQQQGNQPQGTEYTLQGPYIMINLFEGLAGQC